VGTLSSPTDELALFGTTAPAFLAAKPRKLALFRTAACPGIGSVWRSRYPVLKVFRPRIAGKTRTTHLGLFYTVGHTDACAFSGAQPGEDTDFTGYEHTLRIGYLHFAIQLSIYDTLTISAVKRNPGNPETFSADPAPVRFFAPFSRFLSHRRAGFGGSRVLTYGRIWCAPLAARAAILMDLPQEERIL